MIKRYIYKFFLTSFFCFFFGNVYSDSHNIQQILESLQQDIKTLERAVYSDSFEKKNTSDNQESFTENSSEEALTRHLLKL